MTAPLAGCDSWGVGGVSVDDGARELYAILRPDGRVCLGGARAIEPGAAVGCADDGSLSDEVGGYLRRFLADTFPALGFDGSQVEAEWTGVLGFTSDGRPLCGAMPGRPGVLVAAGFCGHGSAPQPSRLEPRMGARATWLPFTCVRKRPYATLTRRASGVCPVARAQCRSALGLARPSRIWRRTSCGREATARRRRRTTQGCTRL
eukprot:856760-Prymnesium_polylepis.1